MRWVPEFTGDVAPPINVPPPPRPPPKHPTYGEGIINQLPSDDPVILGADGYYYSRLPPSRDLPAANIDGTSQLLNMVCLTH